MAPTGHYLTMVLRYMEHPSARQIREGGITPGSPKLGHLR